MDGQSDGQFPDSITVGADGEQLGLDELLTGRGFVTGKSGSGKSNTVSVVAEEVLQLGLPLLIVDTDGEYYGLGEAFDVLHVGAGEDCDVAIDGTDPARLAELALDENVPVILDVSGVVDPELVSESVESVLRELFAREADRRRPFLVVVEEIHEYVPQQGGLDDLGTLLLRIAKRGRKRGLGVCGLSQRPAAVDKEFVTQCDWFVWHRLTWESDVDVVRRFLDADRAAAVEELDDGEAFVVTDWDDQVRRIQFRRKRTRDAGATPSLADLGAEPRPDDVDPAARFAVTGEASAGGEGDASAPEDGDQRERDAPDDPADSFVVEAAALLAYLVRRVVCGVARWGRRLVPRRS